jgi:hypothetical protein
MPNSHAGPRSQTDTRGGICIKIKDDYDQIKNVVTT